MSFNSNPRKNLGGLVTSYVELTSIPNNKIKFNYYKIPIDKITTKNKTNTITTPNVFNVNKIVSMLYTLRSKTKSLSDITVV